ncbi:hypothetical protein A3Q56_06547 [Intoshia linei]|uniref:Menin n=1 Tax=Intoshia linei TaxID=1819745 RepID=A0A177AWE0_9BILA|nr:hypothetical protein A3Q56_06547 [Intoshia linei]
MKWIAKKFQLDSVKLSIINFSFNSIEDYLKLIEWNIVTSKKSDVIGKNANYSVFNIINGCIEHKVKSILHCTDAGFSISVCEKPSDIDVSISFHEILNIYSLWISKVESVLIAFESSYPGCDLKDFDIKIEIIEFILTHFNDELKYTETNSVNSIYHVIQHKSMGRTGFLMVIVAIFQLIGVSGVNLCFSEGRSWLFIESSIKSAHLEISYSTSYGWFVELDMPLKLPNDWLYQRDMYIKPSPLTNFIFFISNLNTKFYLKGACHECIILMRYKEKIFSFLFENALLYRYPPMLTCLAQMQDYLYKKITVMNTTEDLSLILHELSILSSKTFYKNSYVIPYLNISIYWYHRQEWITCLEFFVCATKILSTYSFDKADYLIQFIVGKLLTKEIPKCVSMLLHGLQNDIHIGYGMHMIYEFDKNLNKPEKHLLGLNYLFNLLLLGLDNICQWEEKKTIENTILHVGYVGKICSSIQSVRAAIITFKHDELNIKTFCRTLFNLYEVENYNMHYDKEFYEYDDSIGSAIFDNNFYKDGIFELDVKENIINAVILLKNSILSHLISMKLPKDSNTSAFLYSHIISKKIKNVGIIVNNNDYIRIKFMEIITSPIFI